MIKRCGNITDVGLECLFKNLSNLLQLTKFKLDLSKYIFTK